MQTATTKKLFAGLPVSMAFIIMMIFSFTFVNAQTCPQGKIPIYKCSGVSFGCNSRCAKNVPSGWSTWCPCDGRLSNPQSDEELSSLSISTNSALSSLSISPNPVSGSSVIFFFLEQSEKVSLKIFDVKGKLVLTLVDKMFEEGENELVWSSADVNAGIYFLQMESASYSENQKLIVTK